MSSRPKRASSSRSCGTSVRWPGRQRTDADDVYVVLDRLPRRFGGRAKQRADVDVEAEIGKRGGDHLLTPVVAILAHLGHQNPRPSAFLLFEAFDQSADFLHFALPSHFSRVHATHRSHGGFVSTVHLVQRLADFADGRLGSGGADG